MKIYRLFFYTLMIFLTISCSDTKAFIYYSYKGTTVTRIDAGARSFFYLGEFSSNDKLPNSFIKASYSGRDGIMSCFLIFKEGGHVGIVDIDGVFDTINTGNRMRLIEFQHNPDFIKWDKSIEGKYAHRIQLFDTPKMELENNAKNHSEVVAIYPEGWTE